MVVIFTKEFVLNLQHTDVIELKFDISTVKYEKPKYNKKSNYIERHKRRLARIELKVDENAWSANKNKNIDDLKQIEKNIIGILNKLSPKKYDIISKQFIEAMDIDVIDTLIPKIYEIVLKMLCYNECYCNLIKLYNNEEFNEVLLEICEKENAISLGEIPDEREYTSLLEDKETIQKRYKKNNIMFVCDLYKKGILQTDDIFHKIIKSDDIEYICIMMNELHLTFKSSKNDLYDKTKTKIKECSQDKKYSPKIRFACMDIIDAL